MIPLETSLALFAMLLALGETGIIIFRRQLRRAQAKALFEGPDHAVFELDRKGRVRRVNSAFSPLTGRSEADAKGAAFAELLNKSSRSRALTAFKGALKKATPNFESDFESTKGSHVRVEITLIPIVAGRWVFGAFAIARDLRSTKDAEDKLKAQALHDYLTGLPNRALLHDRLLKSFQRARRSGRRMALLYFDLDRFKAINDTAGHAVGDQLLQGVAARLECFVREGDTVARLGGDEFAVLLDEIESTEEAMAAAQRVSDLLGKPIQVEGTAVLTGASVGVAISSPEIDTPDELVRRADVAMYEAKRRGGHQCEIYAPELDAGRVPLSLHLEGELRAALARDELTVYYQAIVDLAGTRIVGAEALVRWHHPEHGLLGPSSFIPLAESSGLIVSLDRWVLDRACTEMRVLEGLGVVNPKDFTLSVNFSKRMVDEGDPSGMIEKILDSTGFDACGLLVEVTESVAVLDSRKIEGLKTLGLRLAIDDFGTSYSSLAYLSQLSFDVLKIDQSFIAKLHRDQASDAIVRTILTMANMMNLSVITEGVEDLSQVNRLREIGARLAQGYYFSEPVDFKSFKELFQRGLAPTWARRPAPASRGASALPTGS